MARVNEVLIEVRSGRTRTALIADGRMVEMIVEDDDHPSLVGNIYMGRKNYRFTECLFRGCGTGSLGLFGHGGSAVRWHRNNSRRHYFKTSV